MPKSASWFLCALWGMVGVLNMINLSNTGNETYIFISVLNFICSGLYAFRAIHEI